MKKKLKIIITLLFVVCCLLLRNTVQYSPIFTASAASKTSQKNKKAKKAFNEYMSQNEIAWPTSGNLYLKQYYSFKYIELGKKKVPVLIISCSKTCHAEEYVAVLQYIDGKVQFMFAEDWVGAIYQKCGVVAVCHSGGGYGEINTWYYSLNSKGRFGKSVAHTAILSKEYADMRKMFGDDKYVIGTKKVSANKFKKWIKKKTDGKKALSNVKLYKNTTKNRNKYLK